ncbi:hypothetical protein ND748_10795 [Frankia sp. AiPs1]|uniref:hypothetical protein n=1 Tax=Frankia sp. AiPs1 TaxID=573493 RepID=UPI0020445708|nr:hypothetical protein [Frankia sp. AiPs1]MCM3922143.1 hypothetical protein [Frankia sp. AiPs1]
MTSAVLDGPAGKRECRRQPDPAGRGTLLSLTEGGAKVVGLLRRRLADALGRRLVGWPAAEAEAFVTGLERFVWELREQR